MRHFSPAARPQEYSFHYKFCINQHNISEFYLSSHIQMQFNIQQDELNPCERVKKHSANNL